MNSSESNFLKILPCRGARLTPSCLLIFEPLGCPLSHIGCGAFWREASRSSVFLFFDPFGRPLPRFGSAGGTALRTTAWGDPNDTVNVSFAYSKTLAFWHLEALAGFGLSAFALATLAAGL